MTRRVLVPMDDSEPARAALEHALSVFPNDEVAVVHVVDELEAGYGGRPPVTTGGEADADEPDFFADVRSIAAERDRTVETAVIEGTSAEAILEHAREADVDQIVMGSEGRSGVSRMLLGSVAEAVTRQASVPVTIVP
ncbi:universal stress protein [Haloterrigena sp. SYSU A558-1]|uniref:Universal stress protein n=1 Tax=Haloterrigena gelatinilytica TaxID=2741724 RepID=A0A8J8KGM6_9EURY|nr:universal stress protein [Haloterrigena gelatinilytica]NUB90194.1 universal stress protein [Haloterrigena gelatinilytica]NUC73985.1 universal stress protein [Haloterrigena gelatinilytica]